MDQQEIEAASNPVSLWLAICVATSSFLYAFVSIVSDSGLTSSNFTVLFDHPGAFLEFIAEAIGYSFSLPLIHLGIASCFKSKRNENTRRLIFIGWGIAMILLTLIS